MDFREKSVIAKSTGIVCCAFYGKTVIGKGRIP
jgi:hypothetical protein